jgi:hypothetical protein
MPESHENSPISNAALDALFPIFDPDEEFDILKLRDLYTNNISGLSRRVPEPEYTIDALVTPMARPAENIVDNARVAKATGAMLLAFVSRDADPERVATILSDMSVPNWRVTEIPKGYKIPGVELTSQEWIPDSSRRDDPSDLSVKRMLGYLVARQSGMKKIVYGDDDIRFGSAHIDGGRGTFRRLSHSLDAHDYTGPQCAAFPDKAVDDHGRDRLFRHHASWRIAGVAHNAGNISGNSFGVNVQNARFFSPLEIYNEDLLSLYEAYLNKRAGIINDNYYQAPYDPYADPNRGKYETFGEFIYEGLYRAKNFAVDFYSDHRFWQRLADSQNSQIAFMLKGLDARRFRENFGYMTVMPQFEEGEKEKIRASFEAILETGEQITGPMCADYVGAWRRGDEVRWNQYLDKLPVVESVEEVLDSMELSCYASSAAV